MKLLLIHVSKNWQGRVYPEYPLGLGVVATLASRAGHQVFVHDMAVDDAPLLDVLDRFHPDVIGLSFLSTSASQAAEAVQIIRTAFAGPLLSGGIHTTLFPAHALGMGIDVAVVGEGEPTLPSLLAALDGGGGGARLDDRTLAAVPGIAFRKCTGEIMQTPPAACSVDLETLPPVDRRLFDLSRYPHHSLITSRGCPFQCKFCCAWGPGGSRGRTASPDRVLSELEHLVEFHEATTVYWADDLFFLTEAKRIEFCQKLRERRLPLRWIAQLRADQVTPRVAEAMAEAGCVKLCLGAEAGSEKILEACGKNLSRADLVSGISAAREAGLRVKTWWIAGLPGGSFEDQLETLDVIEATRPNEAAIHSFVPLPGSHYWDHAERYGIHRPPLDQLGRLFYYGAPGDVALDYLPRLAFAALLRRFEAGLVSMGYVPTDRAQPDSQFVFTSPSQATTFTV